MQTVHLSIKSIHQVPTLHGSTLTLAYSSSHPRATAIGKNMANAKAFLEKRYNEDMEIEDVIHTAILTLKEGFEGVLNENSIEIGIAYFDEAEETGAHVDELDGKRFKIVGKFRLASQVEIKDYLMNIQ